MLLEASGREGALLQDYPTTVVLRFWGQDAIKTTQGHAGSVLMRRGVALRVWIARISLQQDAGSFLWTPACVRNTSIRSLVFPHVSSGWPTEARQSMSFRQSKLPPGRQLSRLERIVEQASIIASRAKGKGNPSKLPPSRLPLSPAQRKLQLPCQRRRIALTSRRVNLNALESKIVEVEDAQDHLDLYKLDSRFNEIDDQLRQLLQLVNPRDRGLHVVCAVHAFHLCLGSSPASSGLRRLGAPRRPRILSRVSGNATRVLLSSCFSGRSLVDFDELLARLPTSRGGVGRSER